MSTSVLLWVGFNVAVLIVLAIDLGLAGKKDHAPTPKEAAIWTTVWVSLSLAFCGLIGWLASRDPTLFDSQAPVAEWFTAYLVEYALSVDNLFVFLMLFSYFRVKPEYQHRVLFWGVVGAFVMRAALIFAGAALVQRFQWLLAVFGVFLVFTGLKMLMSKEEDASDPEQQPIMRFARKVLPVSPEGNGHHFTVMHHGRRMVTPLFLVLLSVEATDLLFALDSIPAVIGITQDTFLLYTSNICAVLGLRSLFFIVASMMDKFHYLKVALALILAFVGLKMLVGYLSGFVLEHAIHVPVGVSLGVIASLLVGSIVLSLIFPKKTSSPPAA